MRGRPRTVIDPDDRRYRSVFKSAEMLRAEEVRVDAAREALVLTMREAAEAGLPIIAIAEAAGMRPETASRKIAGSP